MRRTPTIFRSLTAVAPRTHASVIATRPYSIYEAGGKMGEREKAVEERAIKAHDQELLRKLRETLNIEVSAA